MEFCENQKVHITLNFRLNRPVQCMLDRDEDMVVSGTRHPFLGKYKVGFTKEGKITACDIEIYNNAGHTLDLSGAVSGVFGSVLGFSCSIFPRI